LYTPRIDREDGMRRKWALRFAIAAWLLPSAASATVAPPVVPEPTGLALFAVGAAAVVVALRLRRP
jgi:hypothetical protein